jgi:hypothetical protein
MEVHRDNQGVHDGANEGDNNNRGNGAWNPSWLNNFEGVFLGKVIYVLSAERLVECGFGEEHCEAQK